MTGKIEAALEALEREGLLVAAFSELESPKTVANRVRLAKRALEIIAGESHNALAREVNLKATGATPKKKVIRFERNIFGWESRRGGRAGWRAASLIGELLSFTRETSNPSRYAATITKPPETSQASLRLCTKEQRSEECNAKATEITTAKQ